MKKQAATILTLMLFALTGLVSAQTRMVAKARVPFDFMANGKTMPAGECTIEARGDGPKFLLISSGKQNLYAIPNSTQPVTHAEETMLVFHRYGDRYFLFAISGGKNRGYELPAGKLEVELRAQNIVEKDVTLLANAK